jgi:EAL domain-containing protein (putative c-di-GMP-specific phosphodiesterase class I)
VIAESVENEAVLEKLREIGVDYAQGFGVGRPEGLEKITAVSVADLLG